MNSAGGSNAGGVSLSSEIVAIIVNICVFITALASAYGVYKTHGKVADIQATVSSNNLANPQVVQAATQAAGAVLTALGTDTAKPGG
jgi:hypothetical protein